MDSVNTAEGFISIIQEAAETWPKDDIKVRFFAFSMSLHGVYCFGFHCLNFSRRLKGSEHGIDIDTKIEERVPFIRKFL